MMPFINMPQGFSATGVNSGVRRYRPDIGLVKSDFPCVSAGTFTKNTFKAAPVLYNMALLPSDTIRALVVNSGHANAATGEQGALDNLELAQETARALGFEQKEVLVASTGVVGERLPLVKLIPAIPQAIRAFGDTINNFALAIMTTDLVPKFSSETFEVQGKKVTLTACSKGSGMIHPNMATMLGFVFTDAALSKELLQKTLSRVVDETFNMISVDGETSTNDMVLALANGASGATISEGKDLELFENALRSLCKDLAIAVARDGEGATKLITVDVEGAHDLELARECARMITISPLIKSAIHGEDPNWGRILVRLGQSGVPSELFDKLEISLQNICVFREGSPQNFDRASARQALQGDHVTLKIFLGGGPHRATAWGCDLTKRYVEINTEYS
jgi:glutamate N-acetyltransferase / amino-acid N-acetyltransferase